MPFDTSSRFPQRPAAAQVIVQGASDVERRFMNAVYGWMTVGMVVTGLVAYAVAGSSLWAQPWARPLMIGLFIAQMALVFAISAAAHRVSAPVAGGLFTLYAALNGVTFSILLLVYTQSSIASAFFITGGTFAAMSVFGTVTRRDLSGWSTFLFMGLIGIVIASVVNIFLRSDMVGFVVSCAMVVVFTGLTAYDTQKLRAFARAGNGTASLAVNGALSLYLDFINLFLAILRLLGDRR
ncbi:MAG: Bax inhibitor-1/YccA family protein [Anaeromyxobacter sp.]